MRRGDTALKLAPGFTMIEVLIAIVIIGIIAAMVHPAVSIARLRADRLAFIGDVRQFAIAALRYHADTGEYVKHAGEGHVPEEWEPYIDAERWAQPTPIGGAWEVYRNSHGVRSAVGIHFKKKFGPIRDQEFMADIDALVDDGDIHTGNFRKVGPNRYAFIVADRDRRGQGH
jgi:prepilin-type N-terminal cleavage/methylation domain-containing protein